MSAIRPDIEWQEVSRERYWDMLELLWPACNMAKGYGFLVGEAWDHGPCTVTGEAALPRYAPFLQQNEAEDWRDEAPRWRYFEGDRPMTLREFRALRYEDIDAAIQRAKPLVKQEART